MWLLTPDRVAAQNVDRPTRATILAQAQLGANADAAATARADEAVEHLNREHFGKLAVVATTTSKYGEKIDWVDPHTLDRDFDTRIPPTSAVEQPPVTIEPPHPTLRLSSMPDDPAYRGPAGKVPILRPNLSFYVNGSSKAASLSQFLDNILKPQPAGRKHLYAGRQDVDFTSPNVGAVAWLNVWNIQQVPSDGMSLAQLALAGCLIAPTGNVQETFGLQKLPELYGDNNLHIFSYFTTNGYALEGDYIGGYNRRVQGFVPNTGAYPIGATIPGPYSSVGGIQYQRRLRIVKSGNAYWLQDYLSDTAFTNLGYYPVGTAAGQINDHELKSAACRISWFGETGDKSEADWAAEDMAGGQFSGGLYGNAGFFRNMINERSSGNVWFSTGAGAMGPVDSACYTEQGVLAGSGDFTRVLYYGGPGGDAPGCN